MGTTRFFLVFLFPAMMVLSATSRAAVSLPAVFNDNMVLQRNQPVPVWGRDTPGQRVTVILGRGSPVETQTDAQGNWRLELPAREAGGPLALTVHGSSKVAFDDVLIGEVWVCSGQSNMQWPVTRSLNAEEEIAAANHPRIRLFTVPRRPAARPEKNVDAGWVLCSPETAANFSACGYFFGRQLHEELQVPIGLIDSSWGGTRIEPWTPPAGFGAVPALADIHAAVQLATPGSPTFETELASYIDSLETWLEKARQTLGNPQFLDPAPAYPEALRPLTSRKNARQQPTALYNGMIAPLIPFAVRGAIWYQGEANHREGMLYTKKMEALISGWRQRWDQAAFPFYYVQIAPFKYGNEDPAVLPKFWMAQRAALDIPDTGMVVTNDIGNPSNIHPKNKQEVGRRLALVALARTYGRTDLVHSGPVFESIKIEGETIRISFAHVGSGLASRDGRPLSGFEIIGSETDFVDAKAVIDGDTVVVSSPKVSRPVAVRFAWHKTAMPNLMNKEGLPAAPFKAGEIPERDFLKLRVDEAEDYQLVYDLDLERLAHDITYDVDNSAGVGAFDRVAYFLELQKPDKDVQFVYVSMATFTDDVAKIGVPAFASEAGFQTRVSDMTVVSNVNGIVTGTGIDTGNIEFWSNNYSPRNKAKIPNASSRTWDFGDAVATNKVDGYGSMQVHNYGAQQTLFAINKWQAGKNADIGIGNSTGRTRDWTFTSNASQYQLKRLRVLVRPSE